MGQSSPGPTGEALRVVCVCVWVGGGHPQLPLRFPYPGLVVHGNILCQTCACTFKTIGVSLPFSLFILLPHPHV